MKYITCFLYEKEDKRAMDLALITAKQVFELFILILCGVVIGKIKMVNEEGKGMLSNFLIYFVVPFMIINSYMSGYNAEILKNMGRMLFYSILTICIGMALSIGITFLMKKENLSTDEVDSLLNKQSGVQGISGLAPDFRVIELESYNDNERAKLAMDIFKYSIASYIAKYAVAMNGIDAIVFTGGVGENQINIRKGICKQLEFMGVEIDEEANNVRSEEKLISKPTSKVKIYIIPTNEELMIAKETLRLIK